MIRSEQVRDLLRGQQPIVICPARSIQGMRIPSAWRQALERDRLLIMSPYAARHRRATAELAEQRNRVVAALAAEVIVAHTRSRTKTERLCTELIDGGKEVHVLDLPDNAHLVEGGARPIQLTISAQSPKDSSNCAAPAEKRNHIPSNIVVD